MAAIAAVVVLAACGQHDAAPPATTATTDIFPPAAEPQRAPPPVEPVPGRVVPVGKSPEGVVVDDRTRTVAVAVRDPYQLVILDADSGAVTGRIPLPGSARHLALTAPGGPVLVPIETANGLVRAELPHGPAAPLVITGTWPHDAAAAANGTVMVGNEHAGTVAALRGDKVVKVFSDSVQPAGLAAAGNLVGMVDARKNTLTVYDAERLVVVGSTSAGAGPTHIVADRRGRMIATDTRGDTVRVFDLLSAPREVAHIAQPGGPYGIAYDRARDQLWVASSGTNELIGYDMAESSPREIKRIPTVQNPYTLGVDPVTGRLFVAGNAVGAVQILDPGN